MKRIQMAIYGEPGVGKSVFACKAPKPFFITTDRNYEWLEDFGAKEKDHIQVFSWSQAKKAFSANYDNYETIVVDLVEDLFKWCEYEYCKKNSYEHISDVGYGKGYDITRNEFFIEICKLLNRDKNIILIMHGFAYTIKDRKGIEHTNYAPTNRIPDKVIDMIEGRVRYFLRCYLKAEEINGELIKKRYLSLVPKENEFGIIRGVNENTIPSDIPLDWNEFIKEINFKSTTEIVEKEENEKEEIKVNLKQEKVVDLNIEENKIEEVKEDIKEDVKEDVKETEKPILSNFDKIAEIKAKLAALKLQKGENK